MTKVEFQTDGFRCEVDQDTPAVFEEVAFSYTGMLADRDGSAPTLVVGSDTRTSSEVLRLAVTKGITSAGGNVLDVGIAPTPVIAWAAKSEGAYAISVTASHNPAIDNGFKPFDAGGAKATAEILRPLEALVAERLSSARRSRSPAGNIKQAPWLVDRYEQFVISKLGGEGALNGTKVLIDGAEGAAHEITPRLFRALGAEVREFACSGNGAQINNGNGAENLEGVTRYIKSRPGLREGRNRFLGAFANDGDADRVMGVDERGNKVDGNYWLKLLSRGQNGIVATEYTNTALRLYLESQGIDFYPVQNGDMNVTAELYRLASLGVSKVTRGGEFTGHLIDLEHQPSGDGVYMALLMAASLAYRGMTLADYRESLSLWGEKMDKVELNGVSAAEILDRAPVKEAIKKEEESLGSAGRVIVRPSGTQPIIRVWAEAQADGEADAAVERIKSAMAA